MKVSDAYLDHFRARVIQDALSEATAHYWLRRAAALEGARPRSGDFHGHATHDDLARRDRENAAAAEACRRHATLWPMGGPIEPIVWQALAGEAA